MLALPAVAVDLVERCAAPDAARTALERIAERHPDQLTAIADDEAWARLVAVVAASRSLTELLVSDDSALSVVVEAPRCPQPAPEISGAPICIRSVILSIASRDLA